MNHKSKSNIQKALSHFIHKAKNKNPQLLPHQLFDQAIGLACFDNNSTLSPTDSHILITTPFNTIYNTFYHNTINNLQC